MSFNHETFLTAQSGCSALLLPMILAWILVFILFKVYQRKMNRLRAEMGSQMQVLSLLFLPGVNARPIDICDFYSGVMFTGIFMIFIVGILLYVLLRKNRAIFFAPMSALNSC